MSSDQHASSCPDKADLSAFVDGASTEAGLGEHIASCAECAAVVEAYRRADRALSACMAPPQGLADRIRSAVETTEQKQTSPTAWWTLPVFRLAAAFAVTASALALLVTALGQRGGAQDGPALAGGMTVAPEPSPEDFRRVPGVAQPPAMVAKVGVETDNSGTLAPRLEHRSVAIPPRVRHVWSVRDVAASVDHLKQRLPEGSYTIGTQDGNTFFQVTLSDEKLQGLVDQLAGQKWHLMNNVVPQPRQTGAFTQRDVHYSLVLAQRDN